MVQGRVWGAHGMSDGQTDLTRFLHQARAAEADAQAVLPAVYDELRRIARNCLAGERRNHTLQPTALVHEAYFKLFGGHQIQWNDRGHFFAAAAEAMRRILLEHARRRGRLKRGGKRQRVSLDGFDVAAAAESAPEDVLAVNEALERLEQQDPDLAHLVKLRCFAGLSSGEAAQVLGVSERTLRRDWKLAKAWLTRELGGE
jgi:RNA polymerase sigma factor (TIGR02999 family)